MSQRSDRARFAPKAPALPALSPNLVLTVRLVLAAILLILGAFVVNNRVVRIILLVLSAIASGYDLGIKAFDSVLDRRFFATPILLLFVAFVSFWIGYPAEGAALLLLYQLCLLVISYVEKRSKASALELLNGLEPEQIERAKAQFDPDEAKKLQMEGDAFRAADLLLKIAMGFALVYIFILHKMGDYAYTVCIHRALMILTAAIPGSVVAAMPITALTGLCFSARSGVLYRDAASMERSAEVNVAVLDKAGIFSSGTPELKSFHSELLDERTFMNFVAHAVYFSEQPFAKAIPPLEEQDYHLDVISEFVDVPGCGVELKIGGSPVILATADYLAARGAQIPEGQGLDDNFHLVVSGRYVGGLLIAAPVNENGAGLVESIRGAGMREMILLTEDGAGESQRLGEALGFDEVYGECDNERKLKHVEDLNQGERNKVLFLYANGLEAHSAADVDVRLSEKAKYADATIQPDNAAALTSGIQISRRLVQVAKENAYFVFGVKALTVFLSMIGVSSIWFVLFMDAAAVLASMLNAIRVTKEPLINLSRYERMDEDRF